MVNSPIIKVGVNRFCVIVLCNGLYDTYKTVQEILEYSFNPCNPTAASLYSKYVIIHIGY